LPRPPPSPLFPYTPLSRSTAEEGARGRRRSLYLTADVEAGEDLTPDNLRSIRPGGGLAPKHWDEVLGRRLTRAARRGTPLTWDLDRKSTRLNSSHVKLSYA